MSKKLTDEELAKISGAGPSKDAGGMVKDKDDDSGSSGGGTGVDVDPEGTGTDPANIQNP